MQGFYVLNAGLSEGSGWKQPQHQKEVPEIEHGECFIFERDVLKFKLATQRLQTSIF
jgi:hypothetical protein